MPDLRSLGEGLWHHLRRAHAPFVIQNNVHYLLRIVCHLEQVQVPGADIIGMDELSFHPLNQPFPMFAPKQDEWKLRDPLGLHECYDLEKLVQSAEATRQEHEAEAVFDEAN